MLFFAIMCVILKHSVFFSLFTNFALGMLFIFDKKILHCTKEITVYTICFQLTNVCRLLGRQANNIANNQHAIIINLSL